VDGQFRRKTGEAEKGWAEMARGPCTANAVQLNIEISQVHPTVARNTPPGKAVKALMTGGGCGIFELAAASASRAAVFVSRTERGRTFKT
jgi:hypothetical protein